MHIKEPLFLSTILFAWLALHDCPLMTYFLMRQSGEPTVKKPGVVRNREEFEAASDGAQGPEGSKRAYLKARVSELKLEEKLGKEQVRAFLSLTSVRICCSACCRGLLVRLPWSVCILWLRIKSEGPREHITCSVS